MQSQNQLKKLRKCKKCGKPKLLSEFRSDGLLALGLRYRMLCNTCVMLARAHTVPKPAWDWADAIVKSYKQSLHNVNPLLEFSLEPNDLRLLMQYQAHTCPLTGTKFIFPEAKDLAHGETLPGWVARLNASRRGSVPALVLFSSFDTKWVVGNVLFIAPKMVGAWEQFGGYAGLRQWAQSFSSGGALTLLTPETMKQLKIAQQKEHTHRVYSGEITDVERT